ncbi:histidine kinase dimerization/phosphoacceptor domain -containing protein [Dyadobacter subterraneus]|uniref:histidine kinase n=1 Tax=Dyadobacter subterraneus TaxID=2773304 RepID=A0ABR9WB22_9BACT|nr:histidine kinase dimerization/phosphoacceptor domain -containing protein [Dyadobacter subterraneus]MBE9461434.1 tetratricopeptide repeat protein [Dyadobacter subterraneus]
MLKFITVFCILILTTPSFGQDPGPFSIEEAKPLLLKLKKSPSDTNRVQILLQLSDQYTHRKNESALAIDSALFYSMAASRLSTTLVYPKGEGYSYLQLSRILPKKKEREKGRVYLYKAIQVFSRAKAFYMLGESYFTLAGFYSLSENEIKEKIKFMQQSLHNFRLAGNREKEGHVLKELGDLYFIQGNTGQALATLKHSLKIFQSIKYKRLMGVYDLLGRVYSDLGDPWEGIKYGLLALATAKQVGDTSIQQCTIYNRIGMTYFDLGDFENAHQYYKYALTIAEKYKDADAIYEVASNQAFALNGLNRPVESLALLNKIEKKYTAAGVDGRVMIDHAIISTLRQLKQNAKAEIYCDELLNIASHLTSREELHNKIYSIVIPFYLATQDYSKAEKYLPLHKELAGRSQNRKNQYANFLWQSRLDSARRNYVSAMGNYEHYSALKDSVFNETKIREIGQLEVIYDIEKKDENIGMLTKQSQLQAGMLRQASLVQKITLVSIAMLLIILSLLYNSYRLNQKINLNMQVQQEEINRKNISLSRLVIEKEWLIKEIHHRVKNNLHMVAGLLDSQSEFLKTDEARMAITDSQHRIQSMSMIHQKLYQTENMSTIDISAYVHEMVAYLKDSFDSRQPIIFNIQVERVEMNISYSIPLGLILNEAITNAIKYAFPGDRSGIITIVLEQTVPENFILSISDNGIGISNDFDIQKNNTFGLALIQGLCDDIGGKLEINSHGGTEIRISFVYQPEGHAESIA